VADVQEGFLLSDHNLNGSHSHLEGFERLQALNRLIYRVGQNCIYVLYMTVYLVVPLSKILILLIYPLSAPFLLFYNAIKAAALD
jgi:hypothetical protein